MLRFLTSSIVFSAFWTPAPPLPLLVMSTLTDPVSTTTDRLSFILDPLLDLVRSSIFHRCSYVFKKPERVAASRTGPYFRVFQARLECFNIKSVVTLSFYIGINTCIALVFARPKNAKKFCLFCKESESPLGLGLSCDQAFYDFFLEKRREKRYRHIGRA